MNHTLQLIFALIFIFCVIFAMISDFSRLRIPNTVSIILVAAFGVYALLGGTAAVWTHLAIAGAVFAVMFGFFAMGWIGAGDVKFLGALMLWVGPANGVGFIVLFALLGGGFALSLMGLKTALQFYPILSEYPVLDKFSRWARNGLCPYGLPIGAAALWIAPSIFVLR